MARIVITRASRTDWQWRSDDGHQGVVHLEGAATWDEDPSGNAVTVALALRRYPTPPDRIVYEAGTTWGYRLDPEPPPIVIASHEVPEARRTLWERAQNAKMPPAAG